MFKFERGEKPLSERRNIVVMADEAHRGQYGFDEKIVISKNEDGEKEAHTVIGNARIIHDAYRMPLSLDSQVHLFLQKIGILVKCLVSILMYMI